MKKRYGVLAAALIASASIGGIVRAQDGEGGGGSSDTQLTRDEVAAYKQNLKALLSALGQPPEGYAKKSEEYHLPTHFSEKRSSGGGGNDSGGGLLGAAKSLGLPSLHKKKKSGTGRYQPLSGDVIQTYSSKAGMDAEKTSQTMGTDYQQQLMEAQAAGDFQKMAEISQRMQKQSSQVQMQALQGSKTPPIEINAALNGAGYMSSIPEGAIDPDAVLFEKTGVIAIKNKQGDVNSATEDVKIYFDPVSLKNPKKVSTIELNGAENGLDSKTGVAFAVVSLSGPAAAVEAWAKKVNTDKVLALIGQ